MGLLPLTLIPTGSNPAHLPEIPNQPPAIDLPLIPKNEPAPVFPDMRENFRLTVTLPEEQAQAAEAERLVEQQRVVSEANSNPRGYAQSLVSADQWPCWDLLGDQESGWNPWAVNASSGAYGIGQSLGHGHVYDLGDGKAQVDWMLSYIQSSYGSPCAAWAHERVFNWY